MKIKREEIDVICLALLKAQEQADKKEALVYEGVRKKLRDNYPMNSSMNKLYKEYNKEGVNNAS